LKKTFYKGLIAKKIDIFLMSFSKIYRTLIGVRFGGIIAGIGKEIGILFVCHNPIFSNYIITYSTILGCGYSTNKWIAGCLTNVPFVARVYGMLYIDFKSGRKLLKRQYNFLYKCLGFGKVVTFSPAFVFLWRVNEAIVPSFEIGRSNVQGHGMIDSNVIS
jgi:hypothetical protein